MHEPGEMREGTFELQAIDMLRRYVRELSDEQAASFARGVMAGSERVMPSAVRDFGLACGMFVAADLSRRRHERDRLERQFATSIVERVDWSAPPPEQEAEGVDHCLIDPDQPEEPRDAA